MRISIIAAMSVNRVIGVGGTIPWHIPADLERFKSLTMGHPVAMGRRTWESISRLLPGRTMIVVTRQKDYQAPGCIVVPDLKRALEAATDADEIFICGGAELYREALQMAERIYLTIVNQHLQGDTFFPEIPAYFRKISEEPLDGDITSSFTVWER
jgi:dihydrofolate reductase